MVMNGHWLLAAIGLFGVGIALLGMSVILAIGVQWPPLILIIRNVGAGLVGLSVLALIVHAGKATLAS